MIAKNQKEYNVNITRTLKIGVWNIADHLEAWKAVCAGGAWQIAGHLWVGLYYNKNYDGPHGA